MKPDDTDHTASDNTIGYADGPAGRRRWLRRTRPPRQPSLKAQPKRSSPRRRAGGDKGARLARLTARQLRHGPGAPGSWSRFLVAHAFWILIVTFAAVAAAAALAHSQQPVYKSQALVSVQPPPVAASSGNPPNMATEEGIVTSGAVLARAATALGVPRAVLASGVSASVPGTTTLLEITYTDTSPRLAQQRAQAIARAYVSYRSSRSATGRGPGKTKSATPGMTPTAVLVTPASIPTSPASPKYVIDIGAALIVGLALGVGTAALRDYMDDSLRGPTDLEIQTDAPVLALIPAFRPRRRDPAGRLAIVAYPNSLAAEAYRSLRTRLVEAATPSHAKTLLVTSPGWEDKSTVAANLAAALAQSGRSVVLVSADMRWGRVHELFGLGIGPGLSGLLQGRAGLGQAVQRTQVPRLRLLPPGMPPADPAALLQSAAWHTALSDIRRRADVTVIEAPPVLASPDARTLADLAEMILVVADARRSTRAQMRLTMREVEHVRGKLAGCVLANVGRRRRLRSRGRAPLADGRTVARSGHDRDQPTLPGQPSFEQVENVFPGLARPVAGRSETHAALGRADDAVIECTQVLDPNEVWATAGRGETHEASADYTSGIDLDLNLARTIAHRGETSAAMGRHEEALADFSRAIKLDPRCAWAIGSRGQAYQAMGRHEEALADFSRALSLDRNMAWAIAGRGETYEIMGRHEEALADFSRAIELDPHDSWAIGSRAHLYHGMGRREEALADYSRAVDLDPNLAWAIAGRGVTYRLMGRYEEALADFSRAIDLDPAYAWAIGSRAQAYLEMGRRDDALADFSEAIDLDPSLTWAIAGRGETYTAMGRHEEALADLTRAIDLNPGDAWAFGRRGQAYLVMGRHEEALADLSQAIDLNPGLVWAISSRAQVYEAIGHREEAEADRRRAADAEPDPVADAGSDALHPAERHDDHQEAARRPEAELAPSAVDAAE